MSSGQFFNFTPSSENFKIEVVATGSIGSVEEAVTFSVGSTLGSVGMTLIYIAIGFILMVGVAVSFYIRRKSKCGKARILIFQAKEGVKGVLELASTDSYIFSLIDTGDKTLAER
ncbi:MAG: hypothetical protein QW752_05820 [Thermoplasmata archaeon]